MEPDQITDAQYVDSPLGGRIIRATVNGTEWNVPEDSANTMYAEIMRQVEAGTLTITDAE
jgi:hypothetical protein